MTEERESYDIGKETMGGGSAHGSDRPADDSILKEAVAQEEPEPEEAPGPPRSDEEMATERMDELKDLKLHQSLNVSPNIHVMRVYGGWLYSISQVNGYEFRTIRNTTFVPWDSAPEHTANISI